MQSQRKIYPAAVSGRSPMAIKGYDALLAFFTCFAVHIMSQLPAVSYFFSLDSLFSQNIRGSLVPEYERTRLTQTRSFPVMNPGNV